MGLGVVGYPVLGLPFLFTIESKAAFLSDYWEQSLT